MAEKEETVSFLEKDCKIKVDREKGKAKITMTSKDYNEILASKGATEDVRSVVKKAQTEVAMDAARFAESQFEKLNKGIKEDGKGYIGRVEVNLGVGNDSMRVGITGHKVSEGTALNGKPYRTETYGAIDIKVNWDFGRKERAKGGELDQISASCCKFLGGKMDK